jgi:hypothetical protein
MRIGDGMRVRMSRRKRKAIPLSERLASALACLLPQAQRDELRAAKVPAQQVIRLFSPDHIVLHCMDGEDRWFNLTPRLRAEHAEKSRRDTAIAAKVKRLQAKSLQWPNGGVLALAEVIDRQMPRQARRKGRGSFSGSGATKPLPKPKRSRWPKKGSRPIRWWGVAKKQRGQKIGEN